MTTSAMQSAQGVFQTFIDQWKTGANAEVRFLCERGQLKVNLCADLGPWRPTGDELQHKVWEYGGSHKPSPSRIRRRARRAAEREKSTATAEEETVALAAAEKVEAEKAAAEKAEAEKAAAEMAEAEKVAAEKVEAEKAAAKKVLAEKAAEKAETKKDVAENATATKAVAENANAKKAGAESMTAVSAADVASTSCWGTQQPTLGKACWNCDGQLTPDQQCDGPHGHTSDVTSQFPATTESPFARRKPSPSAPYVIKGKIRMLDGSPIVPPRTFK